MEILAVFSFAQDPVNGFPRNFIVFFFWPTPPDDFPTIAVPATLHDRIVYKCRRWRRRGRVRACRSLATVNHFPREITGNRWIRWTYTTGSRVHDGCTQMYIKFKYLYTDRGTKRQMTHERWMSAFYTSFTADRKAREESCQFPIARSQLNCSVVAVNRSPRRSFFFPRSAEPLKLFLDVMKTKNKLGLLSIPPPRPRRLLSNSIIIIIVVRIY